MTALVAVYLTLVLARVGGFVAFLPVFGGQQAPRVVKLGLAVCLTVSWSFDFLGNPDVALAQLQRAGDSWFGLGVLMAREILLGGLLGFAFGLLLVPARVAGEFLTQEMGLSFGEIVSPGAGLSGSPVTQFFDLIATLVFLTLDVHHVLLAVFHATFAIYPIGGATPVPNLAGMVAGAEITVGWGLMLAAPTALCLFLSTVVLALMSRAAPQMNMFAVGFPVRLIVGLIALLILLPGIVAALAAIFGKSTELLQRLV
jgi:flagellar biosynthetic protein FliR